jgi:hypothetical protein
MKSSQDGENKSVRKELKYCEHCGGLWVRECGAGVVYCENCQPRVADLPIPKKKQGRIKMPVRAHTQVEDYSVERWDDNEEMEFEAAGGVA